MMSQIFFNNYVLGIFIWLVVGIVVVGIVAAIELIALFKKKA